jgi:predicted nuclease with TOPRIM domain
MDVADDLDIQHRIQSLIDEEHGLRSRLGEGQISVEEENQRLRSLEVELDQCWDLLRQRRARREFGEDPGDAQVRDAATVENYRG